MVSLDGLKNQLADNQSHITTVLIHLGFDPDRIKYYPDKRLIAAPRPEDGADNPHGFLLYTDHLRYMYTTRPGAGNIFSLVMEIKHVDFPRALQLIADWLDFKDTDRQIVLPFGGFYKKYLNQNDSGLKVLQEYPADALPPQVGLSQRFLEDGIALDVQEKWGVRYDFERDATLIPINDFNNRLVGCKARTNNPNADPDKRWYAYLPYQKTNVVYGYYENYKHLRGAKALIVFESEKSVLQCASFDVRSCVAIGGKNLSKQQMRILKSLMPQRIYLAYDEDVKEGEIQYECKKLMSEPGLADCKIGYIRDDSGIYLPHGSKASPSDFGQERFVELWKKKRHDFGSIV